MCELMAAITILGAVETAPGWMTIDYAWKDTPTYIEQMETSTEVYEQYLTCFD